MPKLDEPFEHSQLLGFFDWDADFTRDLMANDPCTAMHEEKLRKAIRRGKLSPRSAFDVSMDGEIHEEPCSWLSLQDWHSYKGHNHFGPFIVRIKVRELEDRRFYVFDRGRIKSWRRYYFVQRRELRPMFNEPAQRIDPRTIFERRHDGTLMPGTMAQYEVLLTRSVSLAKAKVEATGHHSCKAFSDKCYARLDRRGAVARLERILECELMPPCARIFPNPFPLRRVIPADRLPQELQST